MSIVLQPLIHIKLMALSIMPGAIKSGAIMTRAIVTRAIVTTGIPRYMLFLIVALLMTGCATKVIPANPLHDALLASPSTQSASELRRKMASQPFTQDQISLELYHSKKIYEAINAHSWEFCQQYVAKILHYNPVSLDANYAGMVCSYRQKKPVIAEQYKQSLTAIIDAIWASGNGSTEFSPLRLVNVIELNAFVRLQQLEFKQEIPAVLGQQVTAISLWDPELKRPLKLYVAAFY